jgi:hypothetical protein
MRVRPNQLSVRKTLCLGSAVSAAFMAPSLAAASEITVEWNGAFEIPDIVDPPGVFLDLDVAPDPEGQNIIDDLDVSMLLPHTWQGDLIIMLEHVDSGRTAVLLDRPGSLGKGGYGFSADNYGNPDTGEQFFLDDEAETPYDVPYVEGPGIPNVTGNWIPDTDLLATFDGDSIVGTWRYWIADQGGGDVGVLNTLTFHFSTIPQPGAMIVFMLMSLGEKRRR